MTAYLFDTFHIAECQLDALWSFVCKNEVHMTVYGGRPDGPGADHGGVMSYRVPPDFRDRIEPQATNVTS